MNWIIIIIIIIIIINPSTSVFINSKRLQQFSSKIKVKTRTNKLIDEKW
jgi:hypothetical protein